MLSTALMKAKREQEMLEEIYRNATQKEEENLEDMYRMIAQKEDGENIIPRYFALKSKHNTNYLRYINEYDDRIGGFLRFSGQRLVSPYTKFEVEYSDLGKGYVHIRCCYNNKYWVRQSSKSSYIVATANQADEDLSKWSCTLFEPIYDNRQKAYRFRHVQLDQIVFLSHSNDQYNDCIVAKAEREVEVLPMVTIRKADDEIYALSTLVDWDSLFILPKHVAFKGDNGQYLSFSSPYLKFSSSDVKESSVVQEIFPTKDGNNHFCQRLTIEGKTSCLHAGAITITKESRMEVVEVVISRTIDNVEYRINDAQIYGQKVVSMGKGTAVNKTKETDTVTFQFKYEEKNKKNWSSSVSSKIGVSVTTNFQVGVPMVAKGKIEVSAEMETEYEWGETHKDKNVKEFTYPVIVPPMSKVKIHALIKQGMCQVPFSYRRTDVLRCS
ncbi:uncharacterized protein LOC111024281 isoform X2 [Momordica charantia]|uniref:Uncharacterized protein LOC111024281 isoform X2 n=1 Tax=Momordica charantia TaxID=3673 RepID=A0A6J1DYR0_MOMCH|nr:uncharacterized protein LOC111024281 isoform X2 [Momordica charantia]